MKIRNGFVSNSSTASFIVNVKTLSHSKTILTEKKKKLLEEYGFFKSAEWHPTEISWSLPEKNVKKDVDFFNSYAYTVDCNEREVMDFLIKNKIPFKSLCHYDHYYVEYDGKDKIFVGRNFGIEFMTYGKDAFSDWKEFPEERKPFWEIDVKTYKKYGYYYMGKSK